MKISLRDTTPEDRDFLRDVYASTRADEMAMLPWPPEQKAAFIDFQSKAQEDYYHERFPHAQYSVIMQNDIPVGRIYILRESNEIRMMDITLLPEHRGQGIGTPLIREVMEEGKRSRKAVQIYVENFNPSRALFERLGFSVVKEEGFNLLFEWNPSSTESSDSSPNP